MIIWCYKIIIEACIDTDTEFPFQVKSKQWDYRPSMIMKQHLCRGRTSNSVLDFHETSIGLLGYQTRRFRPFLELWSQDLGFHFKIMIQCKLPRILNNLNNLFRNYARLTLENKKLEVWSGIFKIKFRINNSISTPFVFYHFEHFAEVISCINVSYFVIA